MTRRAYALAVLILAVVLFLAVNIFSDAFFTTARLDLTENGQFTLAQGTRDIIARLPEPVTLKFYYSRKVAADYVSTAAYAKRVRDLLAEYAALSHGKIVLEDVDPEPFTPEEDAATAAGLTGAPTDSGDTVYFGLVGTNRIDGKQVIPYFTPEREQYLEYDITALLYRLSNPKRPLVGILTSLPLDGGPQGQPLTIYSELTQNFDTQPIPASFTSLPANLDVLMIAQPGTLNPASWRRARRASRRARRISGCNLCCTPGASIMTLARCWATSCWRSRCRPRIRAIRFRSIPSGCI